MRFSVFSAALCAVLLSLLVAGCVDTQHADRTVSQRPAAQQTPSASFPGSGNVQVISRNNLQKPSPVQPVTAAPVPIAKASDKTKVALLLPLSGKNAALGQAMLNAAQQAVFDVAGGDFELQPRDTVALGAEEATRQAIGGGAQLIIGPLFATDIPLAEPLALRAGLSMLTLSTDTSLATQDVYVMGLAPGQQVERVVAYASAHGAKHFAALIPATPYGDLVGQVLRTAVAQNGAILIDALTYNNAADIPGKVKILAAEHLQIDTLFLPESGAELKSITEQLAAGGVLPGSLHILGTGLWDGAAVGKINPLLTGGWYAAPDPDQRRGFVAAYQAAYGSEPPRLATLAYDATALAAVIAKHNGSFNAADLNNPNGFAGLDGIFRLLPSGLVERGLAVNEVTADGAHVVDAAPNSFIGKK